MEETGIIPHPVGCVNEQFGNYLRNLANNSSSFHRDLEFESRQIIRDLEFESRQNLLPPSPPTRQESKLVAPMGSEYEMVITGK
ncbi:hypothetical protein RND71_014836 [Anisodus tanguticus]|uniref:Uncharacterized protein n=1 Tax=Anisodus tanguticus TaxID=243964 RepID=A0AAE1VK82_9SOLA|nr:hypothetical protein RND71_014836 [Anisodus tanguticus]